jgi:hypothetical protein
VQEDSAAATSRRGFCAKCVIRTRLLRRCNGVELLRKPGDKLELTCLRDFSHRIGYWQRMRLGVPVLQSSRTRCWCAPRR